MKVHYLNSTLKLKNSNDFLIFKFIDHSIPAFFFRFVTAMYTIMFYICYNLEKINNKLFPALATVILNSPPVLITILNVIVYRDQSEQFLIVAVNIAFVFLCCLICGFGAIAFDILQDEVRICAF